MKELNTKAILLYKFNKEDRPKFLNMAIEDENIKSIAKINNGFDFLIEVHFKHIKALDDWMESLEELFNSLDRQIFYIIEKVEA